MELKCKFEGIGWPTVKAYTCRVTEASITDPGTIISKFIGQTEAGKEDSSVEGFLAVKCTIKYLPIGIVSSFSNLKHFAIESCGLVSLSRKDLSGLEGLKLISFCNNELTSLPSDLFVGFQKLKFIRFSDNKLEFMSSKLLEPIMQNGLEYVNFLNNTKIDAFYLKGCEAGMTLQQLMDKIDENCKKPEGDPGFDVEIFDERFVKSFADMWTTKAFADFTIVTKDSKEIPVHKCVLGIRSSVFAAAFNTEMEEKRTNRMVIATFHPDAVKQFLEFFYTGRIQDDVHAMDLFALAAQYDVPMLKTKCEEVVLRNLDEANAFEVFELAHLHSADDMKEKAFNQIKDSMPDMKLKAGLKDDPEKLKIIVEAARKRDQTSKSLAQAIQEADDDFKIIKKNMEDTVMPVDDIPEDEIQ